VVKYVQRKTMTRLPWLVAVTACVLGACGGRTAGDAGDTRSLASSGGNFATKISSPDSVGSVGTPSEVSVGGNRFDSGGSVGSGGVTPTGGVPFNSGGQSSAGGASVDAGCTVDSEEDGGPGEAQSDAAAPVAWIKQSQSSNFPGFQVAIYADGSAVWNLIPTVMGQTIGPGGQTYGPSPSYYLSGSPSVVRCLCDIEQVGDVSSIVSDGSFCSKSASFGTRTTISAFGKITADLQCALAPLTPAQSQMMSDCEGLL